jgi:F-type H+-transporting ATPase subunit b
VELDWTTFLLEVINFLILVWLLKHFLYQPVLEVIARRRQKIQAELQQAATTQDKARQLREQYETRLVEWEQEKRVAMEALSQEIARDRERRLKEVDDELEQQRLKHQARDQQQQVMWRSQAEAGALQLGSAFAARLLRELAGPEVDKRLRQLFVDQLQALPQSELARLKEGWQGNSSAVEVLSAAPLDGDQQDVIRQALEQVFGPARGAWQFDSDASLLAGLRVSVGGWILQANLRDELQFFSEAAHGG